VFDYHLHSHKAFDLKPSTLLQMFNKLDIWRKPDVFELFLIVCKADFLGRLGFENRPYPQTGYLLAAANNAQKVIARPYVEAGLKGLAIKEAIAKERLHSLTITKAEFASLNPNLST
jgi:tRNA nucleotidyltransferase (CCA-adding enzyme)